MLPDEQNFRSHLESGNFQRGVAGGRWRLVEIEWPYATFAVSAAERNNAPREYFFRFECSSYPTNPPAGMLWDCEKKAQLAISEFPQGIGHIERAFKPGSIYLPCDRSGLASHPEWRQKFAAEAWSSDREITHYLRILHDYLNSADYTGKRSS